MTTLGQESAAGRGPDNNFAHDAASNTATGRRDFVTATVHGQLFGIPVLKVQDVLGQQRLTRIPLAPPEIAGALNLRGRIVTAIDVRNRLGMPPRPEGDASMSIVVEQDGELYSLSVDSVGEVLSVVDDAFEHNPPTLDGAWREVSSGIYRLDRQLLVIIDVERLMSIVKKAA